MNIPNEVIKIPKNGRENPIIKKNLLPASITSGLLIKIRTSGTLKIIKAIAPIPVIMLANIYPALMT